MTQNSNKINFWRGTRFVFERKIQRNELIVGTVYFVGNSMEDVEGTGQSTYGVIYQAVSENRAVRYGIFATDDDITKLIEELTEKIDEESEERREADENITERIAHLIPEVADAVENHMAIFDSDGRLKDSGRDIVEFLMDGDIDDATIKFENGKLVVQNYSHKHHISDVDGLRGELDTKIGTEKMGTSNGIATLDENAKVNLEQMPYTDGYGIDITSAGEIKTEPITDAEIDAMNAGERNGHLLDNLGLVRLWNRIVSFFVQKEDGKGLSSNDYTTAEKNKLAGIESGAEVNVQSDWNQTNTSADDYIKNKPSVYTKTEVDNKLADKQDTLTFDTTPTANSTNPVTSGGIKTALDAKQATISVTTNTSTPTDNDTIIMQANGVSNTTTFLRRKLSYLWNWIKTKGDQRFWSKAFFEINFSEYNIFGYKTKIISPLSENALYAADLCGAVVEWKTYNENDEVILDKSSEVYKLFQGNIENINAHPLTGEYDILTIDMTSMTDVASKIGEGFIMLYFRGSSPASIPELSIMRNNQNSWVAVTGTEGIKLGTRYLTYTYTIEYGDVRKIKVKVVGKSGTESSPNYNGSNIGVITYWRNRGLLRMKPIVTKYPVKQDLYGEVEAPKFTVRGGTSQQLLLANGTTINMPSTTGTNKDTLLKNLVSGLSNGDSTVTDTTEIVTSYVGANGFNTTNHVNVPYKRPMTKVWDYIKSKADLIYSTITETNKKANRVIDHTWNQPSYSASAGGTHVKICDIPSDCVCVMNVRKSVYGYPSINTLWIGNNNSLDFKSLTETDIVATVSSRICTLSVPAHTASGTPLHTYDFEISVLNKDDLSAITWYDDANYYSPSRPTKPNIVMQQSAPVTDGSLAFNVNSSTHVASVSVDGYTDFVGMLTEDSTSAVLVKLSDEAEGSVYRFTFDHAIDGGVSFSNSNASTVYCEVSQVIHAGDTITLTAVSNTADGWIASVSSAGIISSDNSVNIEWENGVADLSVEKIPFNNLVNNAMFQEGDSPYPLAIGSGAVSLLKSGDEDYPYAGTANVSTEGFKVDDSTSYVYSFFALSGNTYTITISSNVTATYTPNTNKYIFVVRKTISDDKLVAGQNWFINASSVTTNEVVKIGSSAYYIVGAQNITTIDADSVINARVYRARYSENGYPQAFGKGSLVHGDGSIGVGYVKCFGERCVAIGNLPMALGYASTAIGSSASSKGNYSIAIGGQASTNKTGGIAMGYLSKSEQSYSIAIGQSKALAQFSIAIGFSSESNYNYTIAMGYNAKSRSEQGIVIGRDTIGGYSSNDNDYPMYQVKRFTAIDFTENGVTKKVRWVGSNDEVTIVLNGNTITLSAPNNVSKFFIIVNDSLAARIGKPITSYAKINGVETYCNIESYNVTPIAVNGNSYYALWMYSTSNYITDNIDSFSFLAYYKSTYSAISPIALGHHAYAIYSASMAIGNEAKAIRQNQIVIGGGNIPDENALFIIGGGGESSNGRKNILTIDNREIVHARAYVSDPQTYNNGGNSVNLGTITMGILKVTGGGSITFTNQNAVEGHCVKVYASGNDITCNGDTITAGKWREYLFLDGAWRSKM